MDKYRKLINNSIIFAIGNFGSKIINLLMVPLYTYTLSTEEYGSVDLLTTSSNLLFVVLSLAIGEAIIRFIMRKNVSDLDKKNIISSAFFVHTISIMFLIVMYLVLKVLHILDGTLGYFIILIVLQQLQVSISQFVRSIALVKEFAINGIMMTFITATLNILLLVVFGYGIDGFLISIIIANLLSILYLSIVCKIWKYLSIDFIDKETLMSMLQYSIPLIPNGIIWWLINGLTRFLILFFVGTSGNGLFAVASKIPSILSLVTNVFQQAWQLSAYEENDSETKEEFYSRTFRLYYQILFIIGMVILVILKFLMKKIVSPEFINSWQLIPMLLLGAIYQSFSSFMGTINLASMDTKAIFSSTLVGSLLSGIINIILLPVIGIQGAGIGTAFGFIIMWGMRIYQTRSVVKIDIQWFEFLLNNLIFILGTVVQFLFNGLSLIFATTMLFILLVWVNRSLSNILIYFIRYKK